MERIAESRLPRKAPAAAPRSESQRADLDPMSAESVVRDIQSVLGAVVGRLQEVIQCEQVAAWALRESGEPYVAAAAFAGSPPPEPAREIFEAFARLPGPIDLREPGHPEELRRLAGQSPYTAGAPVIANDGTAMAVLLVAEGAAVRSSARPRTLAALDAARRRLEAPLRAALAMGRLRAMDDEVCRLDRLAALGQLTSEIAHEVRNPLVSIKTFLQLLPERRGDPQFFTSFLEIATDELRRIERLLDVVLDHARPPSPDTSGISVDVGAILASITGLVRHRASKRDISLAWEAPPDLPPLAIEDDALRQIVLNLVLNAIDATPEGGAVRLAARKDDGGVAIAVSDTGPGVPGELAGKVFEPFFSTHGGRSGGLGLAITRRIAESARGTIRVADAPGGGAEFRVWLPVEDRRETGP